MWYFSQWKEVGFILAVLLGVGLLAGCQSTSKGSREAAVPKPTQEQLQRVGLLNQTADDMYNKVMQGDFAGGRAVLQQLGDQIPQISYEGITSIEGLNALTQTVTQANKVFSSVKFSPEEGQVTAAKIRLATDALTHATQPMWLQYYKLLQEDMDQLEQAAKEQRKAGVQKSVLQFEQHISVIHPSLLISREVADVEKLDSLVGFVSGQARQEQDNYKQITNILPTLRQHVDKLFMKKAATAYLPVIDQQNPILWTLAIGSFIIAALAFAGWRLAKKDNGVIPVRKQDAD
ncbi:MULTISPECIES: sporulation protein YpjB [unclassified Paenibacillus]|uniref:sporulation protein YpjB n=1 Tax=unclassified Paenibacillus TaxID=185978 RepID=UPI003631A7ED